jgi:hypothetical protein
VIPPLPLLAFCWRYGHRRSGNRWMLCTVLPGNANSIHIQTRWNARIVVHQDLPVCMPALYCSATLSGPDHVDALTARTCDGLCSHAAMRILHTTQQTVAPCACKVHFTTIAVIKMLEALSATCDQPQSAHPWGPSSALGFLNFRTA